MHKNKCLNNNRLLRKLDKNLRKLTGALHFHFSLCTFLNDLRIGWCIGNIHKYITRIIKYLIQSFVQAFLLTGE